MMEEEEEYTKFSTKKKKKGSESIKRFSDEQVKSLESIFGQGTKLEPRKKMEVARDLGLQPRQVSIWFQNKRARWKSKQMEQEYRLLNDSFDALNQQFESLKKENQSLLDQIQKLRSLLENSNDTRNSSRIENGKQIADEIKENDDHRALYSDEDEMGIDDKYLRKIHKREEEKQFLNMSESNHEWCNLPSPRSDRWPELLNESCGPSGWWNLSEL